MKSNRFIGKLLNNFIPILIHKIQLLAIDLIKQRREINLARNYLKASLTIDPHDRQRWEAVNREFNRIERIIK